MSKERKPFRPTCMVLVMLIATVAEGCPNCKDLVAPAGSNRGAVTITPLARGYYYSIVGMVGMPFLLTVSIALAIARERRKSTTG